MDMPARPTGKRRFNRHRFLSRTVCCVKLRGKLSKNPQYVWVQAGVINKKVDRQVSSAAASNVSYFDGFPSVAVCRQAHGLRPKCKGLC